eukprot:3110035-Lingulodinium_polyedra.AAC.1
MRWVRRRKPDGSMRSRLVCRGFAGEFASRGGVYVSTPTLTTPKSLLSRAVALRTFVFAHI